MSLPLAVTLPGEPVLGHGLPLHMLGTALNTCFPLELVSPMGESMT